MHQNGPGMRVTGKGTGTIKGETDGGQMETGAGTKQHRITRMGGNGSPIMTGDGAFGNKTRLR